MATKPKRTQQQVMEALYERTSLLTLVAQDIRDFSRELITAPEAICLPNKLLHLNFSEATMDKLHQKHKLDWRDCQKLIHDWLIMFEFIETHPIHTKPIRTRKAKKS